MRFPPIQALQQGSGGQQDRGEDKSVGGVPESKQKGKRKAKGKRGNPSASDRGQQGVGEDKSVGNKPKRPRVESNLLGLQPDAAGALEGDLSFPLIELAKAASGPTAPADVVAPVAESAQVQRKSTSGDLLMELARAAQQVLPALPVPPPAAPPASAPVQHVVPKGAARAGFFKSSQSANNAPSQNPAQSPSNQAPKSP